jgi:hypothetical protein
VSGLSGERERERVKSAGIEAVLGFEHARSERIGGIAGADGNAFLRDDRTVIVFIVNEMHGCTGFQVPGGEHGGVHTTAVHPWTAELRQQRGMHIDDRIVPAPCHLGRHSSQVAGKGNQVDAVCIQHLRNRPAIGMPGEEGRGDAAAPCALKRERVRAIARHQDDLGGCLRTERVEVVENGLEVAAAAGGKNSETNGRCAHPAILLVVQHAIHRLLYSSSHVRVHASPGNFLVRRPLAWHKNSPAAKDE